MAIDKKLKYKDIKGQKHMLAYITPGEAKQLEKLGGQKTMTKEGIPAYPPSNDARGQSTGKSSSSNNSNNDGSSNREKGIMSQYTGPKGTTGNINNFTSDPGGSDDRSSNLQTYNHNIAAGQADKNPYGPVQYNPNETKLQNFYNTRPKVNIPNFGLSGMFLNLFNKGVNSPIQKFADFGAKKNRSYFEDVIRAGKIPGLDFGTVADMTPEQLENAYGSYMDNRMSGATDAYGNPIGDQGGAGIQTIPLQYAMSPNGSGEAEGIETVASDPFTSRFLQNQPEDIRAEIESRMQNYYTV